MSGFGTIREDYEELYSLRRENKELRRELDKPALGNLKAQHSAAKENRCLKKQVEHLNRRIDSHGFCPDCRDKTDGSCWRCRCQSLERKLYNEER
jgi:hypothetical protein